MHFATDLLCHYWTSAVWLYHLTVLLKLQHLSIIEQSGHLPRLHDVL